MSDIVLPVTNNGSSNSSKTAKLRQRIEFNKWDSEAWQLLLQDAIAKDQSGIIRDTFDEFLTVFPTSARHWIQYVEYETRQDDHDKLQSLFGQCLRAVPNVDLCKTYINYVRKIHMPAHLEPDKLASARSEVKDAFEFVLALVGHDKDSGPVWMDYLVFVKSGEAPTLYEEQQRMDALRKIYHRALIVPLNNIETLWKDYDVFENGLNKLTAKKLLGDKAAGYMTARTAQRDLKNMFDPIEKLQKAYLPRPPEWNDKDITLLQAWKRVIAWEKSNALKLEDKAILHARILYSYKCALLPLRHYPEIWHDAAMYLIDSNKSSESEEMLKSGIEAIPTSLLLNFTFAELEESKKRDPAPLFESLITTLESNFDAITKKYDTERGKLVEALTNKLSAAQESRGVLIELGSEGRFSTPDDQWDGEAREVVRDKQREVDKQVQAQVESQRKKEFETTRRSLTLVWVVYMRVMRRLQGVRGARAIFARGRKTMYSSYQLFVSSALMEYYNTKDAGVAGRIFELGYKTLTEKNDVDMAHFISHYLDFLIQMNDDNNTRALFERALSVIPPEQSTEIWQKFLDYEIRYGDLTSLQKVAKRRAEAFPDATPSNTLDQVAERWSYLDLNHVGESELGLDAQKGFTLKPSLQQPDNNLSKLPISLPSNSSSSVVVPTSLIASPAAASQTRKTLQSVHPERYARPDFTKWTPYKEVPIPGSAAAIAAAAAAQQATMQALAPDIRKVPLGPTVAVPESIGILYNQLPSAATYNGPIIPVEAMIEFLHIMNVPPPSILPNMVQISISTLPPAMGQGPGIPMQRPASLPPAMPRPSPPAYAPRRGGGSSSSYGRGYSTKRPGDYEDDRSSYGKRGRRDF
ncbi:hypothetical protein SmJEL517_g00759 [Synchytrium microbalum]|uniref:Suppressor of forked domain-containing protein n=1 Tax=Synchytrium microbalum TaxID=1806994 RepID=A0A507CIV0_9FUNG|nr:uncharacterized protein SmJEL517_g00759 [Synchytrium microbalum]TPX37613.1 hypothetical protein SmJEL517_g00759 [Synchytrium microbalum]